MIIEPLAIEGAVRISLERHSDERGFFARSYCREEFSAHGIDADFVQSNLSYSAKAHTLRGLHYQSDIAPEPKVIRCVRGAIFDVLLDLRVQSETYKRWVGYQLDQENRMALYAPPGVAHGFLTLVEETEVFYMMGGAYVADAARGVRWDDPAFGIEWPEVPSVISERDRDYPDYVVSS